MSKNGIGISGMNIYSNILKIFLYNNVLKQDSTKKMQLSENML